MGVNCAWGQNRSCSVCCAYAVLYKGWTAQEAIHYVREQNCAQRRFKGQNPLHNRSFNGLIECFERDRDAIWEQFGLNEDDESGGRLLRQIPSAAIPCVFIAGTV